MSRESPCCVWDLTVWVDKVNAEQVECFFRENCKKWCFQLESGEETGKEHYQCRVSLQTKKREASVLELIHSVWPKGWGHLSRTSSANQTNQFYVMKKETRVAGPWTDQDAVIPWQYLDDVEWYPWQEKVIEIMNCKPSKRRIHVIVDRQGRSGKSTLACWHGCRGLARILPMMNDYKDLMRIMCDVPDTKCLFIDVPRGLDKKQMRNFFAAMETIKSGYAFDDRYHFKEKWFGTPHIFIFTNKYPDLNLLTMDRWVIHDMDYESKTMNRINWNEAISKSNEDNGIWE